MGFNVVKAVGMSFRNEEGNTQIVLTSNDPQTLLTKYEAVVDDDGWDYSDSEGGGKRKRRNKTHKRKRKRKRKRKTKGKKKRRKRAKTKRRRR